jgi:hypothetical protein
VNISSGVAGQLIIPDNPETADMLSLAKEAF